MNNPDHFPNLNLDALKLFAAKWHEQFPVFERITLHAYLPLKEAMAYWPDEPGVQVKSLQPLAPYTTAYRYVVLLESLIPRQSRGFDNMNRSKRLNTVSYLKVTCSSNILS